MLLAKDCFNLNEKFESLLGNFESHVKEVFSLQNQHLAELSHLDRRLTGCLREKADFPKVLILNEVRDVCLGLFIND